MRAGGPAACSTAGGGWLSGWPASSLPRHPLNTYDTPGTLPSVAEGVVDGTVCFDVGGGSSCYAHVVAPVVNCGGFFLWKLPNVPRYRKTTSFV